MKIGSSMIRCLSISVFSSVDDVMFIQSQIHCSISNDILYLKAPIKILILNIYVGYNQ